MIFYDSLSSLFAIYNKKIQNPLIVDILEVYTISYTTAKTIIFAWVPSHMSIPGNDKIELAAKAALNQTIALPTISFADFKHSIYKCIHSFWQGDWSCATDTKLHTITPQLHSPVHTTY